MGLTRRAAKQFAEALYIKLHVPLRNSIPVTGSTRVHLAVPGGPSLPVTLKVVDDFGNKSTSSADAGLLLQGPGSLAVFIGRSCALPDEAFSENKEEVMTFAIIDARVMEEKTGSLAGSLGACLITTVEGVINEFADAIKHVSDREQKENALWR
jgi:hypothetical protein